jgi:hypothetical protein
MKNNLKRNSTNIPKEYCAWKEFLIINLIWDHLPSVDLHYAASLFESFDTDKIALLSSKHF